jgi:SAM-dependent methyltransferase
LSTPAAQSPVPAGRPILDPVPALARPPVRLFLVSATVLFAELLLIRWIPANVIYVGFFRNFLLMASFLGIGIGILWGRNPHRIALPLFGPVLLGVTVLVMTGRVSIQLQSPGEIFFGLSENAKAADVNFLVLPAIVALVALLMAGLAVPLGGLLKSMPPLRAYTWDIAGSMAGIAAFTVLSGLGTSPVAWFLLLGVLLLLGGLAAGIRRASILTAVTFAATVLVVIVAAKPGQSWSPYYRIDQYESGGINAIGVNGIPHQGMWPVDRALEEPMYGQVYDWFPDRTFDNVLIVGAGSGTDVAVALAKGATHIDAVEIDPAIQQIGVEKHPDRPYDDPRVTRINDDGRAFIRRTKDQYDLVVFALPDSLTLVSTSANLRLESFLFTREAFAEVRDRLAPGGVFVLYNYYRQDWLPAKIGGMLQESFGTAPIARLYGEAAATLAIGPGIDAVDGQPPGDQVDAIDLSHAPQAATDDWPFLYLIEPYVAPYYLGALALILAFAGFMLWRAAKGSGTSLRRFSPHFFLLGVAFLLLETRALVTFSLLFGSTWIVNSLVFFAVLTSVLLAIAINARFRIRNPVPLYTALLVSIAIAWWLPPATLLIEPAWLRYLIAGILAFAPVFFANLVFSHSFRDTWTADMAFASNLLGAMVGGALEYIGLLTGYQLLLLIVAALYVAAWLASTRVRLLADADLADACAQRPGEAGAAPAG